MNIFIRVLACKNVVVHRRFDFLDLDLDLRVPPAFGDLGDLGECRGTTLANSNAVCLHNSTGILQWGDRRDAVQLHVRTNSLANGFG